MQSVAKGLAGRKFIVCDSRKDANDGATKPGKNPNAVTTSATPEPGHGIVNHNVCTTSQADSPIKSTPLRSSSSVAANAFVPIINMPPVLGVAGPDRLPQLIRLLQLSAAAALAAPLAPRPTPPGVGPATTPMTNNGGAFLPGPSSVQQKPYARVPKTLSDKIETIPEVRLNVAQKACHRQVLSVIKQVKQLVGIVREEHPRFRKSICHLGRDQVVDLFMSMLDKQRSFLEKKLPSHIDIGYHYTNSEHIPSILEKGLLSKRDLQAKGVTSFFHGSVFGNGVYTCDGPAFSNYGNNCLLVARLKGTIVRVLKRLPDVPSNEIHGETILGNKALCPAKLDEQGWPINDDQNEVVLRSSAQCVALVSVDKFVGDSIEGGKCIDHMKNELQKIFDKTFNEGMKMSASDLNQLPIINPAARSYFVVYNAPLSLASSNVFASIIDPPLNSNMDEDCAICQDSLHIGRCAALSVCKGHVFHYRCIRQVLAVKSQCPVCRVNISEPQGLSPSGSMTVTYDRHACQGFDINVNTIVISYDIPSGLQKIYHENPGQYHSPKYAKAYLPNNAEGKNLLKRLTYSFRHGLAFTVGTSLTTGAHNQCTWASIPHKTSTSGGTKRHGFPDMGYFFNCNEELDALCVPKADALDVDGNVSEKKLKRKSSFGPTPLSTNKKQK